MASIICQTLITGEAVISIAAAGNSAADKLVASCMFVPTRFIKFEVKTVRRGPESARLLLHGARNASVYYDDSMQFSELTLYDENGHKVTCDNPTNPGGRSPFGGTSETPANAIDHNYGTKYLDENFGSRNGSVFIVHIKGAPRTVRSYEFATGNDADSRDPTEASRCKLKP